MYAKKIAALWPEAQPESRRELGAIYARALGAVAACLLSEEADLAIAGPVVGNHPELDRQAIGQVELVPVVPASMPQDCGYDDGNAPYGAGDTNTGDLAVSLGNNMWVQLGIQYTSSSGQGQASLASAVGTRRT